MPMLQLPELSSLCWEYRLRMFIFLLVASCIWVRGFVVRYPPGARRLIAALPAILALYLAPLIFDPQQEMFSLMSAAYLSARMPATKVSEAAPRRLIMTVLLLESVQEDTRMCILFL